MPFFALKYAKEIFFCIAIAALFGYVWYNGYNKGHTVASKAYKELIDEQNNLISKKVNSLELLSNQLVMKSEKDKQDIQADMANILTSVKNKPAYIIQDGKCKPSKDYINAINAATERANK